MGPAQRPAVAGGRGVRRFSAQPLFPLIRVLYRGPIVADAYFSLYDTMVHDKRRARPGSLTGRLCFWLDQFMLRHADICFTDTSQHVQYLRDHFDTPDADVRRLWISAESGPLVRSVAPPAPGEPFEVLFWGGFIPLQGVDTIIEAASLLVADKVRFTIYGSGQTFEECVNLKQQLGASNVEFGGWQPFSQICHRASRSHVALGIFGTTGKAARVIPNKAYEALAMGLPLITRHSPACDELLCDGKTAMLVDAGNACQLADTILQARDDWQRTRRIGQRGQRLFQTTCSPQCVSRILARDLQSLWSQHPNGSGSPASPAKHPAVPAVAWPASAPSALPEASPNIQTNS